MSPLCAYTFKFTTVLAICDVPQHWYSPNDIQMKSSNRQIYVRPDNVAASNCQAQLHLHSKKLPCVHSIFVYNAISQHGWNNNNNAHIKATYFFLVGRYRSSYRTPSPPWASAEGEWVSSVALVQFAPCIHPASCLSTKEYQWQWLDRRYFRFSLFIKNVSETTTQH